TMAVESRGGRTYLYTTRREGGRQDHEYHGPAGGPRARLEMLRRELERGRGLEDHLMRERRQQQLRRRADMAKGPAALAHKGARVPHPPCWGVCDAAACCAGVCRAAQASAPRCGGRAPAEACWMNLAVSEAKFRFRWSLSALVLLKYMLSRAGTQVNVRDDCA